MADSRMNVPNRTQLSQYSVNRPGWEAIRQSLFHFQAYAAAGTTQLTFFQTPIGSATGQGSDTNMQNAGLLPTNQEFLVQSIEVYFFPTVPAVAAANPSAFGAQAVAAAVNDAYLFGRTGNLAFVIGSKPYLNEAPLGRFPGKVHFAVDAAVADISTTGASMQSRIAVPYWVGRPYLLSPADLYLISTQNFSVTLNWPEGAQAIANPARVGVVLDGYLYRRSQ
jgi:hypothetical protein